MTFTFEQLSVGAVEDWKTHPGTDLLVALLHKAHDHWLGRLENAAANGHELTEVSGLGGRCAILRQLIREIKDAKGAKPE